MLIYFVNIFLYWHKLKILNYITKLIMFYVNYVVFFKINKQFIKTRKFSVNSHNSIFVSIQFKWCIIAVISFFLISINFIIKSKLFVESDSLQFEKNPKLISLSVECRNLLDQKILFLELLWCQADWQLSVSWGPN